MRLATLLPVRRIVCIALIPGVLAGVLALAAGPPPAAGTRRAAPPLQQPEATPARHVDRTQLMRDAEALASPAFEGRATGTPGGLRARRWIADQFKAIGLSPLADDGYTQPFAVAPPGGRATRPGDPPRRAAIEGANVVGRIAGRNPGAAAIVVTAHYDHLGVRDGVVHPGADDNASGVAVLLAAARHFAASAPPRPIVFGALDAEEMGLEGARALLRSPLLPRRAIALNINLDMVSRSAASEIYAAGTYHSPWQVPILADVQRRASVRILFGHDRPAHLGGGLKDWTHSSDHGPFHDAGVPFVYFGVEDHADYHTPTDTADRVDPAFFGDAADMIVEAIRTFAARLQ